MITVLMDTLPLGTGHAARGIGSYTRNLLEQLEDTRDITILRSSSITDSSNKPDIIHYPFFDLFFNTLPLIKTAKTVVTIHDVIPLIYPEYYKPGLKGKLRFQLQKLSLKTVAAVLTDSEHSKKDIISYLGVPEDKIHVVYLAANPELEPVSEYAVTKLRKKYSLP